MIPWYKSWYLIDEIETRTILQKDLVILKFDQFFNAARVDLGAFGYKPRHEYSFDFNQRSDRFRLEKRTRLRSSESEEDEFVARGRFQEIDEGTLITVYVTAPIFLIVLFLVINLILLNQNTYLALLVFILGMFAYFWMRNKAKEQLLKVDIEINKCLKS